MVIALSRLFLGAKTVSCHREVGTHLPMQIEPTSVAYNNVNCLQCMRGLILPYRQVMHQSELRGRLYQSKDYFKCNCFLSLFHLFSGVHLESSSVNHPELCEKQATQPMVYVVAFDNSEYSKLQCAVLENIHTLPIEGIAISWGVGGSVRPKNLRKCMKLDWNFQRVRGVLENFPAVYIYLFTCTYPIYVFNP